MPRGRPRKKEEITIKSRETQAVLGFLLTFLGIALFFNNSIENTLTQTISLYFGQGLYILAVTCISFGLQLIGLDVFFTTRRFVFGLLALLLGVTAFVQWWIPLEASTEAVLIKNGGQLGYLINEFLYNLVGPAATLAIIIVWFIVALSMLSGLSVAQLADIVKAILAGIVSIMGKLFHTAKENMPEPDIIMGNRKVSDEDEDALEGKGLTAGKQGEMKLDDLGLDAGELISGATHAVPAKVEDDGKPKISLKFGKDLQNHSRSDDLAEAVAEPRFANWKLPPTDLLDPAEKDSIDHKQLTKDSQVIEQTFASFNIQAKVIKIYVGPSVVQHAISLAIGTKISKVQALAKDIGLALAAPNDSVRIDTISGTSLVGVEVPRRNPKTVHIREIVESEPMSGKSRIPLAIGQDLNGNFVVEDLASMPHLLIAGATGTGKSVTLNGIIVGFLMKYNPDELKMILVDPKMVELTLFNNIPHLLTPVITEKEKVINALDWAIGKMTERYKMFQAERVRNIVEYNDLGKDTLSYIVIVIDEMADLMLLAKGDIEQKVVRLAQLARATGIHLILATQRPSVNVITGLIKANIPARIALAVSSGIDSRVIIDQQGAETLLGKGDMLIKTPNSAKLRRVQGGYVSNTEITKVTNFIKSQLEFDINELYDPAVTEGPEPDFGGGGGDASDYFNDPIFKQAVEITISSGKASASSLQRYLKVGFNRAARMIDQMEEIGIVSKPNGSKPREVLVSSIDEVLNE